MGQRYTIKKFKADWGFFSLDQDFVYNEITVPNEAYRWRDDVGESLTGCLETIARRFNGFASEAWRSIEKCQDLGIEEADPYESKVNEIQSYRIEID